MPSGDAEADGGDQQEAHVVADAVALLRALEVGQREHPRQGPENDAVEDAQRAGLEAEDALQVQVAEAERGQADAEAVEVEGVAGGHGGANYRACARNEAGPESPEIFENIAKCTSFFNALMRLLSWSFRGG